MSADYQTLMLVAILASFLLKRVVVGPFVGPVRHTLLVILPALLLMVFCYEFLEMPRWQVFVFVMSFTSIGAVYESLYDHVMHPYIKGSVMEYGYLAHIGIWSALIAWLTRWTF